jgi:cytochrome c oxidase cbb3-type subunit IV
MAIDILAINIMESGTLQSIGTVLAFVAFVGVCLWAYSGKRKQSFTDAANLPFADEHLTAEHQAQRRDQQQSSLQKKSLQQNERGNQS